MFKRWFNVSTNSNGDPGAIPGASGNASLSLIELAEECERPASPAAPLEPAVKACSFEQIYQSASVHFPRSPYNILKVVEMASSPHLKGMTPEAKRGALMMALEAAGAGIEDLLQDAMGRQRALNDYADKQQERLNRFEAQKAEENRAIQTELDRVTSQYMARIQANVDDVARQQDALLAWQKRKQEESQRIADAAAYLVPEGSPAHNGGLTAVLERASQSRRP